MRKTNRAFSEVTEVKDIKQVYTDNIKYLTNGYFNIKLVEYSVSLLDNLTKEQEKYFLELVQCVDKRMNSGGQANKGLYHKIPTILASTIYIANYYPKVKDYQKEELATLGRFSSHSPIDEYEKLLDLYTSEILNAVISKSKDFFAHHNLMLIVEKMLSENKNEKEIIDYITNKEYPELRLEATKYEKELIDEVIGEFKI